MPMASNEAHQLAMSSLVATTLVFPQSAAIYLVPRYTLDEDGSVEGHGHAIGGSGKQVDEQHEDNDNAKSSAV